MTIRLFLLEPDVIFAARVNQSGGTYPLGSIEYDGVTIGAFGDIEVGMTVFFGTSAGANDLGASRIRLTPDVDTIFFGGSSRGVRKGEVDVVDDAYITVLNDYRVWSLIPRIASDGTLYKDFDLTVGTKTGDDIPPVANSGVGFAATIDGVTSLITASWDASASSFAVADGATIAAYTWDVVDGSITVGTASTAAITATFPAGFRWVKLTVTDSNANTHSCRMPVYARDPASDTTISAFQISRRQITPQGQRISLTMREDIATAMYPNETLVMLWEDEPISASDRSHMIFIGWHHNDPSEIDSVRTGVLSDTHLECLDVAGKLDRLPGFTQEIENVAEAAVWTDMKTPNMDKYLHYLLNWHSTVLELADWTDSGTGSDNALVVLGSDGESLFDQIDRRAKALVPDYRFTCNRLGQMATSVDPMMQDTGDRTSTIQAVVSLSDWKSIQYTAKSPTIHWNRGNAVLASSASISAKFCVAPGELPGQGESAQETGEQLAQSQSELNSCEGHRYARVNAPEGFYTLNLGSSDDLGIEPADMTWVKLTITPEVAAKRGLNFTDERGLVSEVNISYSHASTGLTKQVSLTWERETSGTPAVTYEPEDSTYVGNNWNWGSLPIGKSIGEWTSGLRVGTTQMAAFFTNKDRHITNDFETTEAEGEPTWSGEALDVNGTPDQFVVNGFSPGYIGTGTTINGWLATSTGIYTIDEIFGTPIATLRHSFAFSVSGISMDFSFGIEGWGICIMYYGWSGLPGTWATFTTDGGITWSADAQISSGHVNSSGKNAVIVPGLHVSSKTPGLAYTFAFTGGVGSWTAVGALRKTTDYGATWSTLTPGILANPYRGLGWDLHFPYDDNDDETICFYSYNQGVVGTGDLTLVASRDGGWSFRDLEGQHDARWGIVSSPQDRQYMAMSSYTQLSPKPDNHIKVSTDGGVDWSVVRTFSSFAAARVAIAGDNKEVIYLFGGDLMEVSSNSGALWDNRFGNLPSSKCIGICGGPTT